MSKNHKTDIKEQIKKMASLALYRARKIHSFDDVGYDFYMTKQEIIDILKLFEKAKMLCFKFVPLEDRNDNYDFGSVRRRTEFKTGRFFLFCHPNNNSKVIMSKLKELTTSPKKLNSFVKKYAKYIKLPITNEDSEKVIGNLKINLLTGDFIYYNKKGFFNTKSQEYKILYSLIKNPSYQSSHGDLLKIVHPGGSSDKSNRDTLYTTIKKINIKLGILPKSNKSNKELIKVIRNFGYRIIIK